MKRVRAAFTVASQQEKCVLFICSLLASSLSITPSIKKKSVYGSLNTIVVDVRKAYNAIWPVLKVEGKQNVTVALIPLKNK